MKVKIDKRTLLTVYCYCREAERSVHKVLDAKWAEFQHYYGGEKTRGIQQCVQALKALLSPEFVKSRPLDRETAAGYVSSPGIIRYYFGKWFAQRKKAWTFHGQAIHFLVSTLESLLGLLDLPHKPDRERLITMRMDFCVCEYIVEARCHGLRELELGNRMEHFHQTEWLPTVKLEEVLGGPLPRDLSTPRQSA